MPPYPVVTATHHNLNLATLRIVIVNNVGIISLFPSFACSSEMFSHGLLLHGLLLHGSSGGNQFVHCIIELELGLGLGFGCAIVVLAFALLRGI
jgi:hypothetical protein